MGGRARLGAGLAGGALCAGAAVAASAGAGVVVAAAVMAATLGLGARPAVTRWAVAAAAVVVAAVGEPGALPAGIVLLAAAHAFFAGRDAAGRRSMIGLGALLVAVLSDAGADLVPDAFAVIVPWGLGRALGEHEVVAARLAQRARELEEEREAHAQLSVRYERARIAAELHDIVAHAISVMVVQAGAGQRLAAVDPGLTAEAFDAIAGAAQQAEADLGRLVTLLSDEDAVADDAPELALVEELVARAADSGLSVTLRLEGQRDGLPAPVVRTAYRVVQESLTNALRYGAGAEVAVLVRGEPDALVLEIVNGAAGEATQLVGQGSGRGLRGLRGRVADCGGHLEAGPTPQGGWRVTARLPRRGAPPSRGGRQRSLRGSMPSSSPSGVISPSSITSAPPGQYGCGGVAPARSSGS